LWQLFVDSPAYGGGATPFQYLQYYEGTAAVTSATSYLNQSLAYAESGIGSSYLAIYAPVGPTTGTCPPGVPCATRPPQEFLVVKTPEPATVALLALDLLAMGFAVVYFRRRRQPDAV
jgi:hypothetical protein